MTDQSPQPKQTVAKHTTVMARSKETLLLIAECQQESDRIQQKTIRIQQEIIQIQQANAQQIAANAQAIAELRATLRD